MKTEQRIYTIAQRFNYAVMAFALGVLCHSISHFGWTLNVLLVASACAVAAAVNHIILGGYLHGSNNPAVNGGV